MPPGGAHLKMMHRPFQQRKGHVEVNEDLVSTNSMLDTWHSATPHLIVKNTPRCMQRARWLSAWALGSGSPEFKSRRAVCWLIDTEAT